MQLPLRIMWPITSLAILPLLFPTLETADVSSRYLLDEVGCFDFDFANILKNHTVYNYILHNLDLAIDTCKKDLEMYIGIGPNTRAIDADYFIVCGGNELITKSTEMDASDCQQCHPDHSLLCGGGVSISVYKIRGLQQVSDRPKTTENKSFVPLYVAVALILIVVIILDTYFYRRCKTGRTRPTLSEYESHEAP